MNIQEQENSVAQDTLEEKKLRFERDKEKWNIWSNILTVLITVGIGTYGVAHINNVYQERQLKREQILKQKEIELLEKKAAVERQKAEMQYLGNFLKHALVDDVKYRIRFAEYFANLTVSPELRQGWLNYLDILFKEQNELEEEKSKLLAATDKEEIRKITKEIVMLRSKLDALPQNKIGAQKVFKVQCVSSARNHRTETTGFRLEGLEGIITVLHGIVGCKKIRIFNDAGEINFKNLELVKADIQHDVALLHSVKFKNFKVSGLPAAEGQSTYEELYIIGYPLGMLSSLITSHINIRMPPIKKLWSLIPPSLIRAMKNRQSPSIEVNVLSLEGSVLPGQSGAPLLNGENQVVGIINGGLRGGTVGVSWAIPLKDIQFQPVDAIREELVRLSNLPLFNDKSVPDPETEKNTEDKGHSSEGLL
jgi:S1-C subfamily serine protease